ncbi:PTS glucose transporter subunit IIB [Fusobacterium necrophorum]|uniref:PTS glucose transporter subunit IIB n=1 Tax=Fusobacterium necrophorum BL TaxID=1441732 RepID=A0AB73BXV8_9FUSO|nr:PTS transporter subunit EIIC [Fusobacterium necrophorum]AYZ72929.1 PTS glucose transporter subunit IIB [Fusobacterium necrophorum]AZW09073.1 PTS glucose transporter subunit IIB [Fusobacterium necrophorum subsp. necrophorum]KDE64526.1 PTS glucose transporter subunit IIB [Fusobacterium necrophorum BL]SDB46278.1 PTS system, sucrose-specific IIC component [Fusobacterium necrophorum]SQD10070.1 PTS system EIIBC component SA0186 [Fusobacterium necrophorum subsp. necrophorum]
MTNLELAKKMIEKLGGNENISQATNCMTRLRVDVKNVNLVKVEELKALEGVLGLMVADNHYQVILGPGKVQKIADICFGELGLAKHTASWEENKEAMKAKQSQNMLQRTLKSIASIFAPLIPAIIAAGLLNGFGSLIAQLMKNGTLSESFQIVQLFFTLIGGGFLGYFAIYTGIRSAEVFGATPALGGIIGGMSIGANIVAISKILGLFNETTPLESILTTGKGGIIGVIFGVWVLAKVEKFLRKRIPDVLELVLTPFLSMLLTGLIFVFVIMPLAGYVSDGLVFVLSLIINSPIPTVRIISGFVLSALFLPMVLLGLHHGLIPIYAVQLSEMGGVSLFPVLAMAGAGQVGAAIAIYIMAKRVGNKKLMGIITGALPAGFLGVGEPLIYGVTLPLFVPFITAGLGAGFGGAYVTLTQVMSTAWGPSGLVAIPLMSTPGGMKNYFIGLIIAYIAGFIVTKLVMKEESVKNL